MSLPKTLPGSQTVPSSPSECGSRPLSEGLLGLLEGPFPASPLKGISSLLSVEHLLASRPGSSRGQAHRLKCPDPTVCGPLPSFCVLPGKQALHKLLQKLERVGRGATLSSSVRMGEAPAIHSVHLSSRTLSSGDQGPSPLCCPLHPALSPSHAQAWDPQDCCPESHLWQSFTAAAGVTHRGGHPQHPTPAALALTS